MSGFPIVDLVIGMIFIYFLLSVICSAGVELWHTLCRTRANLLKAWFEKTFGPKNNENEIVQGLDKDIINHDFITGLSDPDKTYSYIDPKNFVSTFIEVLLSKTKYNFSSCVPVNIDTIIDTLQNKNTIENGVSATGTKLQKNIMSTQVQQAILLLAHEAKEEYKARQGDKTTSELQLFKDKLENWYNASMDRLSGVIKRKSFGLTTLLGVILVLILNINSIELIKFLYRNPEAREKLVTEAIKNMQAKITKPEDTTGTHNMAHAGNQEQKPANKILGSKKQDSVKNAGKNKDVEDESSSLAKQAKLTPKIPPQSPEQATSDTAKTAKTQADTSNKAVMAATIDSLQNSLAIIKKDLEIMKDSGIPIGWQSNTFKSVSGCPGWINLICGWLLSVLAIMLGAPFWFDLLNKIANLRGTGVKPATSSPEKDKK